MPPPARRVTGHYLTAGKVDVVVAADSWKICCLTADWPNIMAAMGL